MPARVKKIRHTLDRTFYVYQLFEAEDVPLYIGKGTDRRLSVQMRKHSLKGKKIFETKNEAEAYRKEAELIAVFRPELNRQPGGTGGIATKELSHETYMKRSFKSRQRVARILWHHYAMVSKYCDDDKLENIRQLAFAGAPIKSMVVHG